MESSFPRARFALEIAAWMPSKNCHQASSECCSASRTRAWIAASVAWRTTMLSPTSLCSASAISWMSQNSTASSVEPVVLLEPARHRAEGARNLPLGREVDRGRRLDEGALLGRQLEPVDQRAGRG